MVFVSKSGRASEMTTPGPGTALLNDSLESSSSWQRADSSVVGPEDYPNEKLDHNAFSSDDKVLGPFPSYVINLLHDTSNWKNRTSGVTKMQAIINELPSDYSLDAHLKTTIELATSTLNDNHFKVTQLGLELIACIVARAGNSIHPFLPSLAQGIMSKVGSNKFVLKQAGLQVLKELMVFLRPQPVLKEVIAFGLGHKLSRVREESLNVIAAALLMFPKSEFNLPLILKDAVPTMGDNKSRVRQAAFESVALICSKAPELIEETVTTIVSQQNNHKCKYSTSNGLNLMVAFQTRLARGIDGVPKLNDNGLVEHSIPVSNNRALRVAGDDVQWILAAGGVRAVSSDESGEGPLPQPRQRKYSEGTGAASSSRPYRSAGKRLPWEVEGDDIVRSHLTMQELAPLPNPLFPNLPSPNHLPFTPPPSSPSVLNTPRKKSYSDMFMTKMAVSHKQPLGAIQPSPSSAGHWVNGGSLFSPNDRGPPLFTPCHPSIRDEQSQTIPLNASMSVTWPRTGGGGSTTRTRMTNQISVDTNKLTGVHNPVKTSVSRPLSKPRVRNPLNAIRNQPTNENTTRHRDSPTQLEKEFLSSANGGSEASKGWAETSWDEEYFNTIPEDMTLLNSSLSSSLSSLCAGKGDFEGSREVSSEVDKLKHIRKEVASRKAQLILTAASASNSPNTSRQSSGEVKHRPSDQEEGSFSATKPKHSKPRSQHSHPTGLNTTFAGPSHWPSGDIKSPTINLNRTYNYGTTEKTYTANYAAKKLGTPLKSFKSSHSQRDRERLLAEGSKVMSLDESYYNSDVCKRTQGKRKSCKESVGEIKTNGQATDIIDMVVGNERKQTRSVDQAAKSQSAGYAASSKKPPLPPSTDSSEPSTSAPPESTRKRSKPKKLSPPLKHHAELYEEVPNMDISQNGSPESSPQEFHPFSSPEAGLRECLGQMEADDWSAKVEGIGGVRRLAQHNPEVLLPRLQAIVFAVEKEVKNLRSSVARAAIACFGDLFSTLGSYMEKELDSVVKVLLHKGAESNTFIREDVEKTLGEMVTNLSHHRCLIALINGGLLHRNTQVRKTTSKHICMILEIQGASKFLHSSKDLLDRTLPAIVQLATDSSVEARYFGKRCLHQLWPLSDFERISSRVLSSPLLSRAKEVVDSLKTKGLGDPPVENHSAKSRHSGSSVRASGNKPLPPTHTDGDTTPLKENSFKKASRQSSSTAPPEAGPVEAPLPDGLLDKLRSSNWNERFEGVADLEEFVNNYPRALAPHLLKVFDLFCPRLTDRNSKVNLRALEAFSNIVPLLCDTLMPVATNIVTALVPNLASRNPTIHSNAMTALDLLIQCIDPVHLLQPVANSGQFGNARVRPIMINKLADLTMYLSTQKPQLISRQVLPVLWHLVSAKAPLTGDTRNASLALYEALASSLGPQVLIDNASHLSPEAQKKLDDLISSLDR